jgi:hypothetical protein
LGNLCPSEWIPFPDLVDVVALGWEDLGRHLTMLNLIEQLFVGFDAAIGAGIWRRKSLADALILPLPAESKDSLHTAWRIYKPHRSGIFHASCNVATSFAVLR